MGCYFNIVFCLVFVNFFCLKLEVNVFLIFIKGV